MSREVTGSKPFRFKNTILSLDTTVIDLCAEIFPWAVFRRTKGAVERHVTLDHDGYLPTVLVITDGKHHDGPKAREQTFPPGTILVFDKGDADFAWFADLTAAGIFVVTRLKRNAAYRVIDRRPPRRSTAGSWAIRSVGSGAR